MKDTLAVILAGGKGERLDPLTRDRAKPAVPFAGNYRIIDYALSNCLNSRIRKMLVLTQYKAMSLTRHIDLAWRQYFHRELNEFIDVVPPQQRIDEQWYQGTADAVYQNIYTLEKERPRHVIILAGDHIYKMDYRVMIDHHQRVGADLTIGALVVDQDQAKHFGVMQVNEHDRIIGFEEKPADPKTIPGRSDRCLASMGIYVFSAGFLFDQLCRDATTRGSQHDFGRNIIPSIIHSHNVFAFPFVNEDGSQAYWKDVGTLDAYYEANMELLQQRPSLDMYDPHWPIRTYQPNTPPPRFVSSGQGEQCVEGKVVDSIACQGSVVYGGHVESTILSSDVRVGHGAHVEDSILFDRVHVGADAQIRRAIIEKGVRIPKGIKIGHDLMEDKKRGFTISPKGVVVIAKGDAIEQRFADESSPRTG